MIARLLGLLAVFFLLAGPLPALASGGAKPAANPLMAKIPIIRLEFYDNQGIFHTMEIELTAYMAVPGGNVPKTIGSKLIPVFSSITWEDMNKGNVAANVKAMAYDTLRKEPGFEQMVEILVTKLLVQ